MKQLKQFCATTILILVIGVTALGGDVSSSGGITTPPSENTETSATPNPNGATDINSAEVTSAGDSVLELAFDLCTQLLLIF